MQTLIEDLTPILPSNLEGFFNQLIKYPNTEQKFWYFLLTNQYSEEDEIRLVRFLENKRFEVDADQEGFVLGMLGSLYYYTQKAYNYPQRGLDILAMAKHLKRSSAIDGLNSLAQLCKQNSQPKPQSNTITPIKLFKPAPKTLPSDPEALNKLGHKYQKGDGVPKDIKQAIRYYNMAIKKNSSSAMNNLAYVYQHGDGVPQDFARALDLYQMAAALDEPVAISNLGCMHYFGQGTPIDYETAVIYFRKSKNLSCKAAEDCLIKMRMRMPENTFVQYHCAMALNPKDVEALFKQSSQDLTEIIFKDSFLTDKEKEDLLEPLYASISEPEPEFFFPESNSFVF